MRKSRLLAATLILAICLSHLPAMAQAEGTVTNVNVHLSGTSVLGTLNTGQYSATLEDTQVRNWIYTVYVTADNTTGASPLQGDPVTGNITASNRSFNFDVTAPQFPGDLTIHINISSISGEDWYKETHVIPVVEPIIISADIDNPTDTLVANATVRFYVDGEEIDSQVIVNIPPGLNTPISAEWITAEKSPGWHETIIALDLNGDGDTNDPYEWEKRDRFYVEGGTDWILWLIVIVGMIGLLVGIRYIAKRKMK